MPRPSRRVLHDTEWPVLDVTERMYNRRRRRYEYRLIWHGTDASGVPWPPSWEPWKHLNPTLRTHWLVRAAVQPNSNATTQPEPESPYTNDNHDAHDGYNVDTLAHDATSALERAEEETDDSLQDDGSEDAHIDHRPLAASPFHHDTTAAGEVSTLTANQLYDDRVEDAHGNTVDLTPADGLPLVSPPFQDATAAAVQFWNRTSIQAEDDDVKYPPSHLENLVDTPPLRTLEQARPPILEEEECVVCYGKISGNLDSFMHTPCCRQPLCLDDFTTWHHTQLQYYGINSRCLYCRKPYGCSDRYESPELGPSSPYSLDLELYRSSVPSSPQLY